MRKSCGNTWPHLDLGFVRVRRVVGIGNLLSSWGDALLYARDHDLPMLWPTWAQISWSAYQRERTYWRIFENDGTYIGGVEKARLILEWQLGRGPVLAIGPKEPTRPEWSYGRSAEWNYEIVQSGLESILSQTVRNRVSSVTPKSPFVAVHIRRGDFGREIFHGYDEHGKRVNQPVPTDWYIRALQAAREVTGCDAAVIVSDGTDAELAPVMELGNVSIQREDALVDLLSMSQAKGFVGSGSTFSMWISYLGQMPTWVNSDFSWVESLHLDPTNLNTFS